MKPIRLKRKFETGYRRILQRGLNDQIAYINDILFPTILALPSTFTGDAEWSDAMRSAFQKIAVGMVERVQRLHDTQAADHNEQWIGSVKATIGVDLRGIVTRGQLTNALDIFGEGTANLIKGVSDDLATDISRVTVEALQSGMGQKRLAEELSLKFNEELHGKHIGRTEESRKRNMKRKRAMVRRNPDPTKGTGSPYRYQSRYQLIARDQTSKLNGFLTRRRQDEFGITKYEWMTSRDERVRGLHVSYSGKTYSWDKPPLDGHPGDAVNCRCNALGIIE